MSFFRKALGLRSNHHVEGGSSDGKSADSITKPSDEKLVPSVVHQLNEPSIEFEGPPMLSRGGTRLRTPYEIHGYQFVARLTDKPPGPLYLSVRSGAAVWSSETPAIVEVSEDGKKRSLVWKSERLALRIMHPSQDVIIEVVTRKGDFEENVFGEGVLRGLNAHPQIGAERKALVKLHKPIHRRNSIVKTPQSAKAVKLGSVSVKLYYTAPDDFFVTVVDAITFKNHMAKEVNMKKIKQSLPDLEKNKSSSTVLSTNIDSSPLPLVSECENEGGKGDGESLKHLDAANDEPPMGLDVITPPNDAIKEQTNFKEEEHIGEIDREEDNMLGSELLREFKAAGGSARDLNMSGTALTRRAELLLTAAKCLEDKNLVGPNVRQSLDHLLTLVQEETVRSGAFFAWIEDLMWDLSNLCGKDGGLVFSSVYGHVLEYPILARPMDSLINELPAIKGLDLRPLTFGLNSEDRCIVLRATSAADYVRWTAALATYIDPLNKGRDAPRYCRIGCKEEKELNMGLLEDDEDEVAPAILSGYLYRKKVTKSRLSSASWVKRHFTLRAPIVNSRNSLKEASQAQSLAQQVSQSKSVAQLEWTHSNASAGVEVMKLQQVVLAEPCSPSGARSAPPCYIIDVDFVGVKGLVTNWSPHLLKKGRARSAADDHIASVALKSNMTSDGSKESDRPVMDLLAPGDGPYLVVTDGQNFEHRTESCYGMYRAEDNDAVFGFPTGCHFKLPVEGQELAGSNSMLHSKEFLTLTVSRSGKKSEHMLGSARLSLDHVPLGSERHLHIKLYDVSDWNSVNSKQSCSLSEPELNKVMKGLPVKGTLHLVIKARRVHHCITHWPAAFVPLKREEHVLHKNGAEEEGQQNEQSHESSHYAATDYQIPPSLSFTSPSVHTMIAAGHIVDPTPNLVCKISPDSVCLFPSLGKSMIEDEHNCWMKIPYDSIADILVASPSCLHIHLSKPLILGDDDDDAYIKHHQDMGKCAMEERARNTVIRAKKENLSYSDWLKRYVGEGDYDAEFGERCFRRNEKWHARWEAYCENDEMTFEFTNEETLEIDIECLNKRCDEKMAAAGHSAGLPPIPPDLVEWRDRGGNAVLRLSPCPAASLISTVRERLILHRERKCLSGILTEPDWAHFEVAEQKSEEGKIGVAVNLLDTLRAKQAEIVLSNEAFNAKGLQRTMGRSPSSPVLRPKSMMGTVGTLGRVNSVESLLHVAVQSPQRKSLMSGDFDDVFDSDAAELFRIKFYMRRLFDSCTFPIWRRSSSDFRQCIHDRMLRSLAMSDLAMMSDKKKSIKLNARGEEEDISDSEEDSDIDANVLSERQLAASDDVERTVASLDRLLECLHRLLGEVALAFPMQRAEFLRHAALLTQTMYLTIVSEIGRHVGSSKAISGVTLEALLMLLDVLLKRNSCVDDVLEVHLLKASPSLELSGMLEVSPLLSRFTNRTVLEMVQFSERTVKAYEMMVNMEARGPCMESPEGKWWSRCPEDMMSVIGMYLKSVQNYCRGHDRILAKVLASVLSSFMIHVKSIGRQFDAIAAAFYADLVKTNNRQSDNTAGAHGMSLLRAMGIGEARNVNVVEEGIAEWSGELSIQYLCALINDIGRVINTHMTNITTTHEKIIDSEGLGNGILEVQDVFYAMGNRGATLMARLLVESLGLNYSWARLFSRDWASGSSNDVAVAAREFNRSLQQVFEWIDESVPFFPKLAASASDFFAQAYLWRLVVSLDPSAKKMCNLPVISEDESLPVNFWGEKESIALHQDIDVMSSAFQKHFPDATARSLDEIRETQQILKLPFPSPDEDDESFSAAVDVLVNMVRAHPRHVHARLVKFIEMILVARHDVDSETTHSAISTLVLGLEEMRLNNKPKSYRRGRTDLFSLLFDDGSAETEEDKDGLSQSMSTSNGAQSNNINNGAGTAPINEQTRSRLAERVLGTFFAKRNSNPSPPMSRLSLVSESTDRLSSADDGEEGKEGRQSEQNGKRMVQFNNTVDVQKNQVRGFSLGRDAGSNSRGANHTMGRDRGFSLGRDAGPSTARGSVLSKELMRNVVMRYNANGQLGGGWEGSKVKDIISDFTGGVPQYKLEVTLIEATSLPLYKGLSPKCSFSVGADDFRMSKFGTTDAHQRRILWNEKFNFKKIYNLYGTDLEGTIIYDPSTSNKPTIGAGGSDKSTDRFVIPLACLDTDQVLDDWYLLSNSNGMVRVRLLLREL